MAYVLVYLIELGEGLLGLLAAWSAGLLVWWLLVTGLGAARLFALPIAWSLGRWAVGQSALAGCKRVDGCSFRSGCYEY